MTERVIRPCGDAALCIQFEQRIDPEILARVSAMAEKIRKASFPGVRDLVPAYASLMVCFDPEVTSYTELYRKIMALKEDSETETEQEQRVVEIPVLYGKPFPEDLAYVAKHAGCTAEEVIRRHSERLYPVYMIGFLPGFPYLGNLDERIHTPRRKQPRTVIPAGSVGIGGAQTGVYPVESPGGWHIIGQTPVKLYDPSSDHPVLLKTGDLIRFVPISEETYQTIAEAGGRLCL